MEVIDQNAVKFVKTTLAQAKGGIVLHVSLHASTVNGDVMLDFATPEYFPNEDRELLAARILDHLNAFIN